MIDFSVKIGLNLCSTRKFSQPSSKIQTFFLKKPLPPKIISHFVHQRHFHTKNHVKNTPKRQKLHPFPLPTHYLCPLKHISHPQKTIASPENLTSTPAPYPPNLLALLGLSGLSDLSGLSALSIPPTPGWPPTNPHPPM